MWRLNDVLTGGESYLRSGDELRSPETYVDLEPLAWHFFQLHSR